MKLTVKRCRQWVGIGILVSWDKFKGISLVLPGWTFDWTFKQKGDE